MESSELRYIILWATLPDAVRKSGIQKSLVDAGSISLLCYMKHAVASNNKGYLSIAS
jgi:hypothetical protein